MMFSSLFEAVQVFEIIKSLFITATIQTSFICALPHNPIANTFLIVCVAISAVSVVVHIVAIVVCAHDVVVIVVVFVVSIIVVYVFVDDAGVIVVFVDAVEVTNKSYAVVR